MAIAADTKGSGACPTFFKACCRDSSRGGAAGYERAGQQLMGHLAGLVDEDADTDEIRDAKLEALSKAIHEGTGADVLAWFDREFPRCMALVPGRRRGQFLKGVCRWAIDEGNDVTQV